MNISDHVQYVCTIQHEDGGASCNFCSGGLFKCSVCGSVEASTTTHCPKYQMSSRDFDRVNKGIADYVNGEWIYLKKPVDERGIPTEMNAEDTYSLYCPQNPCLLCTGRTGNGRQTSWEYCQEMNTCSATIDWEKIYGRS